MESTSKRHQSVGRGNRAATMSNAEIRILLVEDDPILGRALEVGLEQGGLIVNWQRGGAAACQVFDEGRFDGLLLDLGLPDMDGLDVLHRIRQTNCSVPIVVVTARTRVEDRIRGLNSGADDYLSKPFELVELLARLRAVKRRQATTPWRSFLRHGDITVDVSNHRVMLRGQRVWITGPEFFALCFLMRELEPVSTIELANHLRMFWEEFEPSDMQRCLRSLSRKLGHDFIALQTRLHTNRRVRLPH